MSCNKRNKYRHQHDYYLGSYLSCMSHSHLVGRNEAASIIQVLASYTYSFSLAVALVSPNTKYNFFLREPKVLHDAFSEVDDEGDVLVLLLSLLEHRRKGIFSF